MIGQNISHYRVVEKIGEGGMGQVFKALDTRLNRHVAIKVLPAGLEDDPKRRERFLREARAASALNHPNIVTIYDILSEGGNEYLVMEYIAGQTVSQMLTRGAMPVPQALQIASQMADALATAHEANIVHRDLKPGNVMATGSGLVKLLDFGLAKSVEDPVTVDAENDRTMTMVEPLTVKNTIIGTPRYMSPEQAEGKKVDLRSDIFTFGVVLYEMITGRSAFHADSTLATLTLVLRDDPKPIAEVVDGIPQELVSIIHKCLRKNPDDREQRMRTVHEALLTLSNQLVATRTVEAKPVVAATPVAEKKADNKKKAAAAVPVAAAAAAKPGSSPMLMYGGIAAVVVAVGVGGFFFTQNQSPAESPVAVEQEQTPPPVAAEPPPPADVPVAPAATPPVAVKGAVPPALDKKGLAAKAKADLAAAAAAAQQKGAAAPVVPTPVEAPAPVAVVAAPTPTALAPTTMQVTLKDGTPVSLTLSVAVPITVDKGDVIHFVVAKEVSVGGHVVIPKGAQAKGIVVEGIKRRLLVKKTDVTMLFEPVNSVEGKHIALRESIARIPTRKPREVASKDSKDKNVAVPAGVEYVAYIDGDFNVTIPLK